MLPYSVWLVLLDAWNKGLDLPVGIQKSKQPKTRYYATFEGASSWRLSSFPCWVMPHCLISHTVEPKLMVRISRDKLFLQCGRSRTAVHPTTCGPLFTRYPSTFFGIINKRTIHKLSSLLKPECPLYLAASKVRAPYQMKEQVVLTRNALVYERCM